jgi:protein-S-isoprenylcysteine O-methyltransferase Ste14
MPLIYSNAFYTVAFVFLFLAWCVSELTGPARWQGSDKAHKQDRGSTMLLAASSGMGVLFFFVLPLFIPQATVTPLTRFMFFGGVPIVIGGTGLRWQAIKTLGASFTGSVLIDEAHSLVCVGPYKYLRHPSYTGILLVVIGFGLMMGNWLSLLSIFIGMLIGLLYRISIEEAALCQHFGQVYRDYMATTKRLIPFLF